MTCKDRLRWLRAACEWSEFDEDVNVTGGDTQMVYMEDHVTLPNTANFIENGSAVYIGRYSRLMGNGMLSPLLTIGRHCTISQGVLLGGGRHHMEYLTTGEIPGLELDRNFYSDAEEAFDAKDTSGFTRIGCDVWVGANASILRGRHVGTGAIVGAGTVVNKDVPPYAVVAGNPARIVRYRFEPPIIESLLRTRWWTLSVEEIKSLPFADIRRCVERLEHLRQNSVQGG